MSLRLALLALVTVLAFTFAPRDAGAAFVTGDILLADGGIEHSADPDDYGAVYKIDPVTLNTSVVAMGESLAIVGLTLDQDGLITATHFADDFGPERLIRINPATGARTILSQAGSFVDPWGVVVGANGSIYVADSMATGNGAIIRIDPNTGAQTIISSGGLLNSPSQLRFGPDGMLYVANGDNIVRVDPVTGAQSVVSSGGYLVLPIDLSFDLAGNLFVADADAIDFFGAVIQVDIITGSQTIISQGQFFLEPFAIGVEPDGNILVADWDYTTPGNSKLIRVDRLTGSQTVLLTGLDSPFGLFVLIPEPAIMGLAPLLIGFIRRRR